MSSLLRSLGSAAVALYVLGVGAPAALAATLAADPVSDLVLTIPGQDVTFDLVLSPGADPVSLFEGVFDFTGTDLLRYEIAQTSPDWSSRQDNSNDGVMEDSPLRVSLTSDNQLGDRVVATIRVTLTGAATRGVLGEVFLGEGTFAEQDIDDPPFTMDVPITTPVGTRLQRIVPEPGSGSLLLFALAGLAASSRYFSRR